MEGLQNGKGEFLKQKINKNRYYFFSHLERLRYCYSIKRLKQEQQICAYSQIENDELVNHGLAPISVVCEDLKNRIRIIWFGEIGAKWQKNGKTPKKQKPKPNNYLVMKLSLKLKSSKPSNPKKTRPYPPRGHRRHRWGPLLRCSWARLGL